MPEAVGGANAAAAGTLRASVPVGVPFAGPASRAAAASRAQTQPPQNAR